MKTQKKNIDARLQMHKSYFLSCMSFSLQSSAYLTIIFISNSHQLHFALRCVFLPLRSESHTRKMALELTATWLFLSLCTVLYPVYLYNTWVQCISNEVQTNLLAQECFIQEVIAFKIQLCKKSYWTCSSIQMKWGWFQHLTIWYPCQIFTFI